MQGAGVKKREAFVARGRGRRQAAEAGADLRSKYADSPRKAPAKTDVLPTAFLLAVPRADRSPSSAENRTLFRARTLSKRYGNAGWDTLS